MSSVITGKRIGEGSVPEDIKVEAAKRIKIQSDVALNAVTTFAGGPFENTGPIPPKVENDTTYTVTLNLTNSSNALERGKVRATLPPYVRWNNKIFPSNENVNYDAASRSIEWDLGNVREHVGFIDPARSISVQLTLNPSTSQLGDSPALLISPTFTGYDTFTQTELSQISEAPTTDMGRLSDLDNAKVVQ